MSDIITRPQIVTIPPTAKLPYGLEGKILQHLAHLSYRREFEDRLIIKDNHWILGTLIHYISTPWVSRAVVWVSGGFPHILLVDYDIINSESAFEYNYYSDSLAEIKPVVKNTINNYPLKPLYNGRSQISDYTYYSYTNKWDSDHTLNRYTYAARSNTYEMGFFYNEENSTIYGRIADDIGPLYTYSDTLLPEYFGMYGSLLGIPTYKQDSPWNLFRGLRLITLTPNNKSVTEGWLWTPSFFLVEPAEGTQQQSGVLFAGNWTGLTSINFPTTGTRSGLEPGFHYGGKPLSVYGPFALESAKVRFMALLDSRFKSSKAADTFNYGWCECVHSVNGDTRADLFFYLDNTFLPNIDNELNSFGYVRLQGTTADQQITIGSSTKGFNASFVWASPWDVDETTVKMWNFEKWYDEENDLLGTEVDTGVCFVLINEAQRHAYFYRYVGVSELIVETENYHSFSITPDGQMLAVFESEASNPELITNVKVYDLYGTRVSLKKDNAYSLGSFTEIIDSAVVAGAESQTACLIPHRDDDFTPSEIIYDLTTSVASSAQTSDTIDSLTSLSTIFFPKQVDGPVTIRKVTCEDGINAEFGITVDECFDSTIIIEDPNTSELSEHLIGSWNIGGGIKGKVRGSFTGAHPDMRFEGEGSGETLTRPDEFSIVQTEGGLILFEDYIGTVTPSTCITTDDNGNYIPDPSCSGCGSYTMTAISSCGQTASLDVDGVTPDPIVVAGDDPTYVGADYDVNSGGVSPFVWTIDSGAINSSTGVITSVTGMCSNPTITATDSCGNEGTLTVESPSPLTITGPNPVNTTTAYVGSGGIGPYTYSADQGTINSSTGQFSDVSGTCGAVTVTVTDSCGDTASLVVKGITGSWYTIEYHYVIGGTGVSNCDCGCDPAPSDCGYGVYEAAGIYRTRVPNDGSSIHCANYNFTPSIGATSAYPNTGSCPDGTQYGWYWWLNKSISGYPYCTYDYSSNKRPSKIHYEAFYCC